MHHNFIVYLSKIDTQYVVKTIFFLKFKSLDFNINLKLKLRFNNCVFLFAYFAKSSTSFLSLQVLELATRKLPRDELYLTQISRSVHLTFKCHLKKVLTGVCICKNIKSFES